VILGSKVHVRETANKGKVDGSATRKGQGRSKKQGKPLAGGVASKPCASGIPSSTTEKRKCLQWPLNKVWLGKAVKRRTKGLTKSNRAAKKCTVIVLTRD